MFLTGCDTATERLAYNISIRNATISELVYDGKLRATYAYQIKCVVNGKTTMYAIQDYDIYHSLERYIKAYALSNPGKRVVLDIIFDTDSNYISSISLVPPTK